MDTPAPDTARPAARPLRALAAHRRATSAPAPSPCAAGASTLGSGVVWRPGLVVTAAHVFRRTPAAMTLVGADGKTVEATLVGIDSSTDLALFRLADDGAPPALAAGDASRACAPATSSIAVGRSGEGDPIASAGIVNRAGGPWQTWLGGASTA